MLKATALFAVSAPIIAACGGAAGVGGGAVARTVAGAGAAGCGGGVAGGDVFGVRE